MPVVSVIVPVFNTEKYLHNCIESILRQTFSDFELILVDDGSTDNCGAICNEYAQKDNRVQVIHQKNQGVSIARNTGIKTGKGRFYCFVDSDDLIHPELLERLYSIAIESESDISLCNAIEGIDCSESFWNEIKRQEVIVEESCEESLYRIKDIPFADQVVWGKLIKDWIVRNNLFEGNRVYEDTVALKWLCEAKRIAIVQSNLYFYRNNPDGIMKSGSTPKKAIDGLWAVSKRLSWMREYNYKELEKYYISRYLYESANTYFAVVNEDKKLAAEIKRKATIEWRNNHSSINFKKGEKELVLEMVFPKIMWLYWIIQRFLPCNS